MADGGNGTQIGMIYMIFYPIYVGAFPAILRSAVRGLRSIFCVDGV